MRIGKNVKLFTKQLIKNKRNAKQLILKNAIMMIIVVAMEILITITIQAPEENVKQMDMVTLNTLKKQANVKRFPMSNVIMSAFQNKYLKKNVIMSKFPRLPKFLRKNATMLKYLGILKSLSKNATILMCLKLPEFQRKNAIMLKYPSILVCLNKNATMIGYPKLPVSLSKNAKLSRFQNATKFPRKNVPTQKIGMEAAIKPALMDLAM